MMMDAGSKQKRAAFLDTLLPGGTGFPSATAVDDIEDSSATEEIGTLLAELPEKFPELSPAERVSAVEVLEEQHKALFHSVMAQLYSAYYSSPSVLEIISRKSGYQHPPQPVGYAMSPFDETILEKTRRNLPSWRTVPPTTSEGSKS